MTSSSRMMLLMLIASAALCAVSAAHVASVKLPEGANGCRIDAPERDECIRSTIERMIRKLSHKGYAPLNIPPIDPLERNASRFEISRGPLHMLLHSRATTVYGLGKTQLKAVRTEITDVGMATEMDLYFPRVLFVGAYKADTKYDGMKINSKGVFNITLTGLSVTHKMDGRFVRIGADDNAYLQLDHFDMDDIKLVDFEVHATGIFSDPVLNQFAQTFANEYWAVTYKQIVPATRSLWEPLMIKEINDFLASVPYDTLLFYGDE